MGHFKIFEHKKVGHFEKKHVINCKTGKEPKMIMFDFGAFQEKMHITLRAKYIPHRLLGAFEGTSRSSIQIDQKPSLHACTINFIKAKSFKVI